jgi:hypothetical protein
MMMFAYQLTMKKFYYSIVLLCFSVCSIAQIIPETNLVDWSDAGYPGNFPEPTTIVSVMDHGAVGDGVADDRPALLAAIAALSSQPGVVLFPAGSYKISSTVSIPSGVVLRGEGVEATFIKLNMGGSAINGFQTSGSITATEVPVVSGYTKGSSQLVIDGAYENFFAEGDYM